ncbi:DUF5330 domain-containing protein [Ancylobacter sp. 6x-1]|uniref:DUF5330 domain-containing protein n=1 Tax=Ancylobacter crimeensis TaxID=2579147 RepID=A0ABT0D8U9_9HYPH|nr:DUF5330 domain-containing protein [Ancylobacter crimeensis]MCK0196375.1 DUF5330 domain-containing protein [Ancylobacter crimeensis]
MLFLLRTAFWLTVVLMLLPALPDSNRVPAATTPPDAGHAAAATNGSGVDRLDALGAAGAALSDATGFCQRQPRACEVGLQLVDLVGERAGTGARMVYDYVMGHIAQEKRRAAGQAVPPDRPSQSTLTDDDLGPAWRGTSPGGGARPAPTDTREHTAPPLPPKRPA